MTKHITILKDPVLPDSENYSLLRQKGMEYIQELGSKIWTDYNIHDPGITLVELLSYAITDIGYRTSLDIKDIIADAPGITSDTARQAFFTARNILTVNPWTTQDFRKLLIDVDGIKNAWLFCKECPCDEMFLYAHCVKSKLQYGLTEHTIIVKGLYDVLVEFEDDAGSGDLNSGKIKYNLAYDTTDGFSNALFELWLPPWHKLEENKDIYKAFRNSNSAIKSIMVKFVSGGKDDNVWVPDNQLASVLRRAVYVTMDVYFYPDKNDTTIDAKLELIDIPLNIFFSSDNDRKAIKKGDIVQALENNTVDGIMARYLEKIHDADAVIKDTKQVLHDHRNLCEDYCTIKSVPVQDVAICADMDVTPDADIEKVVAQAYYLIDQYFSPDIKFYSLKELLDVGTPVEDIYNGPQLNNGFINNDQLAATQLKKKLFASDIINLLMDIPGVVSIRNLVMTKYNDDAISQPGEQWVLDIDYQHQPRLYIERSKFLVFKNGLPFLPDAFELSDTLQVIKGQNIQPKYCVDDNDIKVPTGTYYDLNAYQPLQYSLPLTYGVGYEGLPAHATEARKAQARQLKAYLMFFEQMFVNYLAQISNVQALFALDTTVEHSYFTRLIETGEIAGLDKIYNTIDESALQNLMEDELTFLSRRNRFLDHLLARFAESFNDYALMLYAYIGGKKIADKVLIDNKIGFLKEYPFMSMNRAKAFNYKDPGHVCDMQNISGLQKRIEKLLGIRKLESYFELYEETDNDDVSYERRWRLKDDTGKIYLSSSTRYTDEDFDNAEEKAKAEIREVVKYITDPAMYEVKKEKKWVINLKDPTGETIATRKHAYSKKTDAEEDLLELIDFAKKTLLAEKIFVVEHLLLRPRNKPDGSFTGDKLLPICITPNCELCGEEDPYSFRLTIVMNGESGLANAGIEFRRFAEQTIRLEVPAHLGVKICWIGNEQMEKFAPLYCSWLAELAKEEPGKMPLHDKLELLLEEFVKLKSVYPPASLHDCQDGNDENRVYLNQTII